MNGSAERLVRTLTHLANSCLMGSGLSDEFWADACRYVTFIHNRLPSEGESPRYNLFRRPALSIDKFPSFGAECITHLKLNVKNKSKKFTPRGTNGKFIGWSNDRTMRILIEEPDDWRIVESRTVHFIAHDSTTTRTCTALTDIDSDPENNDKDNEDDFQEKDPENNDRDNEDKFQEKDPENNDKDNEYDFQKEDPEQESNTFDVDTVSSEDENQDQERSVKRALEEIDPEQDKESKRQKLFKSLLKILKTVSATPILGTPATLKQALSQEDWKKSYIEEAASFITNDVFKLVHNNVNDKRRNYPKWKIVFKKKLDEEGNIKRFKTRMTMKG